MDRRVRWCVVLGVFVLCSVTLCLSTSIGQDHRSYETRTQIYGISAGRSDTARAIDAYDALMQRYMDMTERSFIGLADNLDALAHRLEMIDDKLASLDKRLAGIEQHLGVKSAGSTRDPNAPLIPTSPAAKTLPSPALPPQKR